VTLACGPIEVAFQAADGPPPATASALREHDRVVRRRAERAVAVLPARFGTLVTDEAELGRLLAAHREPLAQGLELVAGREQMTVRLFARRASAAAREGPLAAEGPAPGARPRDGRAPDLFAAAGPGARYLERRRRERQGPPPEGQPLRLRLARWVAAERVARHDSPPLLASLYHLIPRGRSQEYLAALEDAARGLALRVRASGPWPPYAFAPDLR
jgi:hypothetical protein